MTKSTLSVSLISLILAVACNGKSSKKEPAPSPVVASETDATRAPSSSPETSAPDAQEETVSEETVSEETVSEETVSEETTPSEETTSSEQTRPKTLKDIESEEAAKSIQTQAESSQQDEDKRMEKGYRKFRGIFIGKADKKSRSLKEIEAEEVQQSLQNQADLSLQDETKRYAKAIKKRLKMSVKKLEALYAQVATSEPGYLISTQMDEIVEKLNVIIRAPEALDDAAHADAQEVLKEVETVTAETEKAVEEITASSDKKGVAQRIKDVWTGATKAVASILPAFDALFSK